MAPGNFQAVVQVAKRGSHRQFPGPTRPVGAAAAHISTRLGSITKAQHLARTGQAGPQRRERVLRREHRHAICGQGSDHRAVFLGHRGHRGHELQVLALCVVDQRHCGAGQSRQQGNFPGMVHAQLEHCDLVLRAQAQQGQRQADVIVQIALGGQTGLGFPGLQNRGQHLGHRGLAIAASHSDQRQAELPAPAAGELGQGQAGVGHQQARQASGKQPLGGAELTQRRHCTTCLRLG